MNIGNLIANKKKTENTIDKPIEGCLLHFNKETGKINVIKKQSISTENFDFDNI